MYAFEDLKKGNKSKYQISGNPVRWDDVNGAADGAVAAVGREDDDGGNAGLQRAMEIGETLRK